MTVRIIVFLLLLVGFLSGEKVKNQVLVDKTRFIIRNRAAKEQKTVLLDSIKVLNLKLDSSTTSSKKKFKLFKTRKREYTSGN